MKITKTEIEQIIKKELLTESFGQKIYKMWWGTSPKEIAAKVKLLSTEQLLSLSNFFEDVSDTDNSPAALQKKLVQIEIVRRSRNQNDEDMLHLEQLDMSEVHAPGNQRYVNQTIPGMEGHNTDITFAPEELAYLVANGFKKIKVPNGRTTQFEKPILGKLAVNVMKDQGEYSVDLVLDGPVNSGGFEFRAPTMQAALKGFYRQMKTGQFLG